MLPQKSLRSRAANSASSSFEKAELQPRVRLLSCAWTNKFHAQNLCQKNSSSISSITCWRLHQLWWVSNKVARATVRSRHNT